MTTVLIDTDPGIDDALALLLAWGSPGVEVEAITTVAGNVAVERGTTNVFRLLALRPLTNLALALAAGGAALAGIGRIVVMGGAVDVPGNVMPAAEFNMHVDPEAAARVFSADLPIDLVPLDATRQATLARADLEAALAKTPGPLASRIAAFTRRAFRLDGGTMYLHDPLAVAAAADPM